MRAVVLAAGSGKRFGAKTKTLPKCLIPLDRKGCNLLRRYLDTFRTIGIHDVVIVVGHLKHLIQKECAAYGQGLRIRFIENAEYRRGSLVSLYSASHLFYGGALIMDADVFFDAKELKKLLSNSSDSAFLIDKKSKSTGEEMMLMAKNRRPWHISKKILPRLKVMGEATGVFKVGSKDVALLRRILKRFYDQGIKDVEYEDAYCELLKKTNVGIKTITGFWSEMDFIGDLKKISTYMASKK